MKHESRELREKDAIYTEPESGAAEPAESSVFMDCDSDTQQDDPVLF